MKLPSPKIILFNAAAAVIGVGVLVGVIKPLIVTPASVPCTDRYKNSTTFALERGGVMLAAADLQSGLGGQDSGLIDNVSIVRVKNGPSPLAMSIKLPKDAGSPLGTSDTKGGVSFPWQPRSIQGKSAACVAYDVLLPADFDFHRGGRLPGLVGADAGQPSDGGFSARVVWRAGGVGGVNLRTSTDGDSRVTPIGLEGFALPRGRWFRIEQEAVLNTPKKADGKLRAWLDGKLVAERGDVVFRGAADVTFNGVAADVFYGGDGGSSTVPKDAVVGLAPFVLRWE